MAEQIPFNIIADVLTKLGSSAIQQIGSAFGVAKELTKLTEKLDAIRGVLLDAEEKQEKSHAVKAWVRRLKDVLYDADDLLDDFATHQLQRTGVARQVSDFFSSSNQLVFRFKMSNRVKNIKEEVDEIMKEINLLKLVQGNIVRREIQSSWRETHSFVLTSEMVERDEDKEEIIKLLVSSGNEKNLFAVAIIGIGGLGKTTLAQLVYNDERVVDFFEPKIWICVSDDFDVKLLVKKTLESLSGGVAGNSESLEVLKVSLHEKLRQKRYLLVLDDVWNDDFQKWDRLRTLLMVGAKGSKILLTTRNRNVASTMGIDHFPFSLKGLKENQSWNLFSKIAFEEGQERMYPRLVEIGKEIVNMCNGVPLIIKTLGAILRFKTEEHPWLSIKNNENLLLLEGGNDDKVLSVLKLSYDDLSFCLKQCFAYCALFPKDYEIEKKLLVQLWMAQGYIQVSDVGNQYFEELLSRSLLEEAKKDAYNNISSCKMHDIIHDLAQSIVGSDVLVLKDNVKKEKISKRVYHVSFSLMEYIQRGDLKIKHIRTILKFDDCFEAYLIWSSTPIPNFKGSRVLSLNGIPTKKIPKSIGKLSHLKYLNLSYNDFEVLPNAIIRLYNLQTLKLIDCRYLKEFPKDTRELINLRHLENDGCESLSYMPCRIGELTLLESLPLFVIGTGSKVGRLSELKRLNNLRGKLRIKKLENVRDANVESGEANLGEKQYIECLELEWSYGEEAQSGEDAESVMVGLRPHRNLKELFITGYGGRVFPSWMMNGGLSCGLPNLSTINLESCSGCQILPPFVELPHLKSLKLQCLEKVEYMDYCSSGGPFFPSLKYLELERMPKLKELWRRDLSPTHPPSFPCLLELKLTNCEELASLELHSSPLLSKLEIGECHKLTSLLLPPSPLLSQLDISNCGDLASLELHSSPLLSRLKIFHCPKLTSVQVSSLPCLKALELGEVREEVLQQLLATAFSLESLSIYNIEDLMTLPDELHQHVSTLQTLEIGGCTHLATLPHWIGNLTSLTRLHIGSCHQLPSLPEEFRSLRILKSLIILDWSGLTTLPDWIGSLSSLEHLQIRECPKLTSLPEEMRSLTTLHILEIAYCPHLSERCQRENGEDWPKIAHVPNISIDWAWV
ncbi:putative disease resistance protein RGA4 [Vitis riparia]|uniref:putative disease resistance protein RGA4 n=1 Tax=Vitis riparia TaxID=96939 RepID=UPI00155A2A6E|nr:putative disease resistance protein RGA4 [Vitis riparia]XP_034678422.1 putative disease resistance protein RGA4 [Vitis riparia]XP_034678423.1 putative disease resistance protein RGA4 [Vitis riparia]XP_034678424.1 putative disease resistance protein RGA4 [Vitis riparia]XP_034678425.1 putative disease resistance protein RGA4 [Vitis riparia]XP_034678426.1 putative disease resistance protein RGA4 [Vitis riparia]XP_034678427.1 putative disease resistance protein RGA4 [Vitis riparia]XP_03467842